jgi:hypothetical protein
MARSIKSVRHLHLFCMGKQMIVNPSREDRGFHGDRPGLRQRHDQAIKVAACRRDLACLVHMALRHD